MSYKTIDKIIASSKELLSLKVQGEKLEQIQVLLLAELAPELQPHVKVADYKNAVLFLELDSAAYATHLRFVLPTLTQTLCLKPLLQRLRRIEYYVQPRQYEHLKRAISGAL